MQDALTLAEPAAAGSLTTTCFAPAAAVLCTALTGAADAGIEVDQIDGEADGIYADSGLGLGARSWVPNGGDNGWTRVTMSDGSGFGNVGFFAGSGLGIPFPYPYYELVLAGAVQKSGSEVLPADQAGHWFGISGGGFDEIRLRATWDAWNSLQGCMHDAVNCNYLFSDDVQIGRAGNIPEPATIALLAGGLAAYVRRHRQIKNEFA